jgi:hypothetical protein
MLALDLCPGNPDELHVNVEAGLALFNNTFGEYKAAKAKITRAVRCTEKWVGRYRKPRYNPLRRLPPTPNTYLETWPPPPGELLFELTPWSVPMQWFNRNDIYVHVDSPHQYEIYE